MGETFEYLQNNTLSRDSLNYKNSNVKNIHYGDILVKFDELLDGSSNDIPYINSELDLSKFSKSLLRDGDIIFSDTAEDDAVGKAIELWNVNDPFILSGLHTIPCRPLIPFGKGYLGNFLNSNSYRMQLRPLVQGIKVSSISKSALKDTMIEYPKNLDEQEKIGSLFYYIAKMITLHQRKLEKLKLTKKALLQKLFPKNGSNIPELRFKGVTDDWEQRKFKDIVFKRGKISEADLPYVEFEDINSGIGTLNKNILQKVGHKKGILFEAGDVLFGKLRPYLQNWLLCQFMGIAVGDFWVFQPQIVSSAFLFYLIQSEAYQSVANISSGTKMPRSSWSLVSETRFSIPKYKEATMIGEFFTSIDKNITLHQRKLDKLQEVKKGLLQKMFV